MPTSSPVEVFFRPGGLCSGLYLVSSPLAGSVNRDTQHREAPRSPEASGWHAEQELFNQREQRGHGSHGGHGANRARPPSPNARSLRRNRGRCGENRGRPHPHRSQGPPRAIPSTINDTSPGEDGSSPGRRPRRRRSRAPGPFGKQSRPGPADRNGHGLGSPPHRPVGVVWLAPMRAPAHDVTSTPNLVEQDPDPRQDNMFLQTRAHSPHDRARFKDKRMPPSCPG